MQQEAITYNMLFIIFNAEDAYVENNFGIISKKFHKLPCVYF